MSAAPHPFDTARENASDTNSVTGGGGGGGGGAVTVTCCVDEPVAPSSSVTVRVTV